ncbi:uncharacterized protein LOC123539590 isoform X2 [Mercenaria mercenaria]|uniref:uncharacterized protein LOC123539590 isoform X2 n=1 Tax=Mercenaria mercenaria TaxID=6596 RepID=UPI00234F7ED4|nr:uncharacterized protein LOC123539590 isoform X2 [Mercenaria mercenaria]
MVLFQIILNISTVKGKESVVNYCPEKGRAHHGEWRLHTDKVGFFCELICHHGYSPSGCTVLMKDGFGDWNYDIPTYPWFSMSRIVCKAAGFIPGYGISVLGFSKAGIVKNSFAAKLMKWLKHVEKGSIFSRIQSASMRGYYPTDEVEIICEMVTQFFASTPNCETPRRKTEL